MVEMRELTCFLEESLHLRRTSDGFPVHEGATRQGKPQDRVLRFRSAHLNRLIAVNRLDRASLIALAEQHFFCRELIDEIDDFPDETRQFLEHELIKIIIKNGKEKVIIPVKPIPINSTDELKRVARTHPKDTLICFTDAFMSEYFDRVQTGNMTEAQLDFYARAFKHHV
jgi:hypothetical protein